MVQLNTTLLVASLLALSTAAPLPHEGGHGDLKERTPTNIYPGVKYPGDADDIAKRTNIYPGVKYPGDADEVTKRTNSYPGVRYPGDTDDITKRTNSYPGVRYPGDTD
ncbi:hypothetical protein DM02DRAFT_625319 [Periconia macrospinosa]|uniref:Uncharacterized protein n=1 Tax=Periconia macrospinosa TaxID=97972 RepID=A0A2V1E1I7_9PLEO|nr:hypothetical protein DM02DRAFT_625319 [Periconia macrospinosa]